MALKTLLLIAILYLIGLAVGFFPMLKAWYYQRPPPGPAQPHSAQGKLFVGYFNALFPQTGIAYLNALTDAELQQLFDSLSWYYLPLVQQIPSSRRAPLTSNSPSEWTQYFAADGTDDGVYPSPGDAAAGTFFCSVFSATIGTPRSEFTCYGQPYQAIQMTQMTGRRNGFPNNAYIEPVAFACEALGKALMTAPKCEENAPALTCSDGSNPIESCGSSKSRPATALVLRGGANAVPNPYSGTAAGAYAGQGFDFKPNQPRGNYGAPRPRTAGQNFIDQNPAYASNRAEARGEKPPAKTRGIHKSVNCANVSPSCPPTSPCWKCGEKGSGCCSYTSPGAQSPNICCWNYDTDSVNPACCDWPTVCSAYKSPSSGNIYSDYCAAPCTWQCDSGTCDWFIINESDPTSSTEWLDWVKTQPQGSDAWVNTLLYQCQPCVEASGKCTKGIGGQYGNKWPDSFPKASFESTMFYWLPGYGKFVNFGKTGVYFQYVHFLMTCPQWSADGKQYMRWSFPQIVQTSVLNAGNSELQQQLSDLTAGTETDARQYFEGYVTTLRGATYEGSGGTEVDNNMKWAVGNVNGMLNPKDTSFLQWLDQTVVTKYYKASDKVKNPQYQQKIDYYPAQAVALVAGAAIYGATGAQPLGYFDDAMPDTYETGFGNWPFGSFFAGSNLGGCAYNTVYRLGWDSVQLTMMPTGMGSAKYCNYPAYDFELVFIGSKQWICQNGMKILDPTQDWANYTQYGFVQGTGDTGVDEAKYNLQSLDATKMALTERNVPCCWAGTMPNATHYQVPDPPIKDTSNCPYRDDVYRYYYGKGGNNGQPPSCG